jgi:tetratricopeptide (TPR) repeat protein
VEYYEQALQIDREVKNAKGEAADLLNLGVVYENLGRLDDASRCLTDALATARKIGYRLIEAAALANIGDLRLAQDDLSDAARQFEQAIEIADDVGNPQISQLGSEAIAEIHLLRNNLGAARILVEAAKQYDVPVRNASVSAMLGMVSLLEGHRSAARDAFTAALNHAGRLLELNPEQYEALDVKGLSLCGLGLCGEPAGIPAAKAAYQAARAVTSDAGIVRAALQRFDSLARADKDGLLAGVRPVAAGAKTD